MLFSDKELQAGLKCVRSGKPVTSMTTLELVGFIGFLDEMHSDLIMAVASKHEGENRHETAKRYIVEREARYDRTGVEKHGQES